MLRHSLTYASPDLLSKRGPLVDVIFSPHPDVGPVPGRPASQTVTMLIDTGAHRTMVDDRVPRQVLGLTPERFDPITGVTGVTEPRPVYRMQMILMLKDQKARDYPTIFQQEIVGMKPLGSGMHGFGLIGRDFLSLVRFMYDGHKGCIAVSDDHTEAHPDHKKADDDDERAKKLARKAKKDARKKNRGR